VQGLDHRFIKKTEETKHSTENQIEENMTAEKIRQEFNRANEEFDRAIQAEIRRLRLLGYSRAAICERSFEIEDDVKAQLWCSPSTP